MRPETLNHLKSARQLLGHCAREIEAKQNAGQMPQNRGKELRLALGTARDWLRWASALEDLRFSTKSERNSSRRNGLTECVRFTQMWAATNALFARDEVMNFAGLATSQSELVRFRRLYEAATLQPQFEHDRIEALHEILGSQCNADGVTRKINKPDPRPIRKLPQPLFPIYVPNPKIAAHPKYKPEPVALLPTMWEVIDQKYSRPKDREIPRSIGQHIAEALDTGDWPQPDGPMIIYGARNWTVHGMLLTSFFRGSKAKYPAFIDNINLLLAAVLDGFGQHIFSKL